jgi:hypothetical protein
MKKVKTEKSRPIVLLKFYGSMEVAVVFTHNTKGKGTLRICFAANI